MRAVERLEQALATAERIGLGVRYEYLDGVNGGICDIAGRKWIFVDLALPIDEQLAMVIQALQTILSPDPLPDAVADRSDWNRRKSA